MYGFMPARYLSQICPLGQAQVDGVNGLSLVIVLHE